ncbi:MAG: indole-3-glycerol phosphate synthase TrpC [Gammaproteobacteria bacterium]|nr:indole-3-glycerol phosphate synthase TrpC [Gammaproteobacteria bacterium]
MTNRLEPIVTQKVREIAALKSQVLETPDHAIAHLMQGRQRRTSGKSFKQSLSGDTLAVIAEIKRRSPSKGVLAAIPDPQGLAKTYSAGGANAISVLTDEQFFGGSGSDLSAVATALSAIPTPILCKDFILDPIQIAQAIARGADAILGVVSILRSRTSNVLTQAAQMGIDILVEVHDERELDLALAAGAEIIGVNNRDLKTFEIDAECALRLVERIPKDKIRIAESGILSPQLARDYHQAGFDAVLIGEALVTATDPADFIGACQNGMS